MKTFTHSKGSIFIIACCIALCVLSMSYVNGTAQGINCTPDSLTMSMLNFGQITVLSEHSRWTNQGPTEASLVCNYNVGGGSAGMAINIIYGCQDSIEQEWNRLMDQRRGQPNVTTGRIMGVDGRPGDEYALKQTTAENGFQGFVGRFPNRDHLFIHTTVDAYADVVILHSNHGKSLNQIGQIVASVWHNNWETLSLSCVVAKVINKSGSGTVEIIRNAPGVASSEDELFEGDVIRMNRPSGHPCCPFITIEWKSIRGTGNSPIQGKAIFKGDDTFFDEFTIRMNRGDSFSVETTGSPIIEFGTQMGIGWIMTKTFLGPMFSGMFIRPAMESSISGDMVFLNLRSEVVVHSPSRNEVEVITIEGSPELIYNGGNSKVTVNTGQSSRISNGTPSQPQPSDTSGVSNWIAPFVDGIQPGPSPTPPPTPIPPLSGNSSAPSITAVLIPSSLPIGTPTTWNINFSDSDGDIDWIEFEELVSGNWVLSGEFDPGVGGQQNGSISISSTCSDTGTIQKRVRLYDRAGNESAAYEYSMNCGTTSFAPPPTNNPPSRTFSGSGLDQFDFDNDCILSEAEFFSATDAWISEEIENGLFFDAVDAWIGQSNVCAASAGVHSLQLNKIDLSSSTMGRLKFEISGNQIAHSQLEIFDLHGTELFRTSSAGSKLIWNLKTSSGKRVSNGVYLYRVQVQDEYGNMVSSEVRKLVVMR